MRNWFHEKYLASNFNEIAILCDYVFTEKNKNFILDTKIRFALQIMWSRTFLRARQFNSQMVRWKSNYRAENGAADATIGKCVAAATIISVLGVTNIIPVKKLYGH